MSNEINILASFKLELRWFLISSEDFGIFRGERTATYFLPKHNPRIAHNSSLIPYGQQPIPRLLQGLGHVPSDPARPRAIGSPSTPEPKGPDSRTTTPTASTWIFWSIMWTSSEATMPRGDVLIGSYTRHWHCLRQSCKGMNNAEMGPQPHQCVTKWVLWWNLVVK